MTPEQQRIAIAEACGWTPVAGVGWSHPDLPPAANIYGRVPPDYLNDLNAMHEAWRSLTDEQSTKAAWMLVQVLDGFQTWTPDEYETLNLWEMSLNDISDCINATPAQYAEAFLKTLNLWKP